MSPVILSFITLASTLMLCSCGLALQVETVPHNIDELFAGEINVTCLVSDPPHSKTVLIELGKKGEHPLVNLRHGQTELDIGPTMKSKMQAEGYLDTDTATGYVRLMIRKPGLEDAGNYICRIFYLDRSGELQEERAYGNVTVNNDDNTQVFTHLINRILNLEKTVTDQKNQIVQMEEHAKEQEKNASYSVAFSAGYNSKDTMQTGKPVRFTEPILNIGNPYNSYTGTFTAPKRGLYVFTLMAMTYSSSSYYCWINLVANGKVVASLFVHDYYYQDQASASTVVLLEAGNTVQPVVTSFSGNYLYATNHYSVFSGYLLKLL